MNLERFTRAQSGVYANAVAELREGQKRGHWMWFIFPQLLGLGKSTTARHFGLAGLAEAEAYLAHPVLGPRLMDCARTMMRHSERDAQDILGPVDALKLRSCATLFAAVPGADPVFAALLDTFFAEPCPGTRLALFPRSGS
ncbi:DUF1810 domain-containing protein [Profundibacterium mesophilum]|uniref:Calpastatin n=1 Tax=Profundibacterium mesophilum KAUST100406-0324 TaxID=1037889 RepID=A0A921NPD7_9RHOB|nr:DUF1810 domain-containing protein [Profundibacterium mesophilum]KAF0675936.1 hypothetical protein PMES_01691 [Profundibacterium mesophilum KAUST100406-0324]